MNDSFLRKASGILAIDKNCLRKKLANGAFDLIPVAAYNFFSRQIEDRL